MWLYLKENILKWHVLCAQYNKCTQIQDFPKVLPHLRKPVVTCSHWNAHVSSDELLLITLLWSTWSAGLGVILYLGGLQGAPQGVQEDGSLHFQIQTCSRSRQNQSPEQFNIICHTSLKGYTYEYMDKSICCFSYHVSPFGSLSLLPGRGWPPPGSCLWHRKGLHRKSGFEISEKRTNLIFQNIC